MRCGYKAEYWKYHGRKRLLTRKGWNGQRNSATIQDEEITIYRSDHKTRLQVSVSVSVSVHILANNALRAHHTSVHDGLTANVLSDICLTFF